MLNIFTFLSLALYSANLFAGWKIHEEVKDNFGQVTKQIIYFQDNKVKTISGSEIVIYNLKEKTITLADTITGYYCSGNTTEYNKGMQDYFQFLIDNLTKTNNNQKQKDQIEYLRSVKERWTNSKPLAPTDLNVRVIETSKKEAISGFNTQLYELRINNILRFEYWISPEINLQKEFNMGQMFLMMQELSGGTSISGYELTPEYLELMKIGYSMRTIDHDDDVVTITKVEKAIKTKLPDSVFTVSKDFKPLSFVDFFKLKQMEM